MQIIHLLLFGFVVVSSAHADSSPVTYDRVTLAATAEKQIENDTAVAQLFSEREDEQSSVAASEVNKNITWALERAKNMDSVSVQTTGYHSQPVYQKQKITGWRVRQSIKLESQDTARLGELIGELQQRLSVNLISYTVSPEIREQAENDLIAKALASFDKRARLVTDELGRPGYRIVRLDIVTSGNPVRPVALQRMALGSPAAAENVSPPTLDRGVQVVRVGVNGIIELKLN